jgi:orotidine-5'-phosphate decarboxylase
MDFIAQLRSTQQRHGSLLCVGLDPDAERLPGAWRGDSGKFFDFCAAIVEATADLACAFKPQIAYFAAAGAEAQLQGLIAFIHERAPGVPVILDAKRGDIGATAEQYAREAFERYKADALTLSPYMGHDSVAPYLAYPGKGLFLLCRTSNPGGADLQHQRLARGGLLFEEVARQVAGPWAEGVAPGRLGLVVGATYPEELARVRALAPRAPLLIPGIGAQGGDARATLAAAALPADVAASEAGPLVINSSRAILYASSGADFAQAARQAALATRTELADAARAAGWSVPSAGA